MTRVNSTCASGASAIGVPGCPFSARCTASIDSPRTTLIARCSRSVSVTDLALSSTAPTLNALLVGSGRSLRSRLVARTVASGPSAEQGQARGEAVEEVAAPDRADLARAERAREGHRAELLLDETGV